MCVHIVNSTFHLLQIIRTGGELGPSFIIGWHDYPIEQAVKGFKGSLDCQDHIDKPLLGPPIVKSSNQSKH